MHIKGLHWKTLALILVFSLSFPWISFSQIKGLTPAAQIVEMVGRATIERQGTEIPAKKNMQLYIGDDIKTQAVSEVCIKYDDGSLLFVREQTDISIQPLPGKPTIGRKIKVMVGKVWARIRPNKAYTTEFETPAAVAAIRGTDVEMEVVTEAVVGWRMVRIGCGSGQVGVNYFDASGMKTVVLEEGKMALFRKGETMVILGFTIGSIAGQGLLALGAKIIPYLIIGIVGAGGAIGAYELYQIIKEEKKPASPEKP
jgi:hypothetical protein